MASVSIEAMCDMHLCCWHAYCGWHRTKIGSTVVERCPLILYILSGSRRMNPPEGYNFDGTTRDWFLYYLVDGIYPRWAILVSSNLTPFTNKETFMTECQEGRKKGVEKLFEVQGRFRILRHEYLGLSEI